MFANPPKPANELARAEKVQLLLIDAIRRQDLPLARKRVAQGASPTHMGQDEITPMMHAAQTADPALIFWLLPLCDPAAGSSQGSPLSLLVGAICSPGKLRGADRLRCVASLRALSAAAGASDGSGKTALMDAASKWSRRDIPFEDALPFLANASNLGSVDCHGMTACAHALASGRQENAILLFELEHDKAQAIARTSSDGKSLAHLAAETDASAFLSNALPWIDPDARDALGRTPLMLAAASCSGHAVDVLMPLGQGALAVDGDGCDALMLAIESAPKSSIESDFSFSAHTPFFDLACASNLLVRDHSGESALDKARDRRVSALAREIAELLDCQTQNEPCFAPAGNLNASPRKLQAMLLRAINLGDERLAAKRISQGADPKIAGPNNKTALMAAARIGLQGLVDMLLPLSDQLALDDLGQTALTIALLAPPIERCSKCIAKLVNPASAKNANAFGVTPLAAAAVEGMLPASAFEFYFSMLSPLSDLHALDDAGQSIIARAMDSGLESRALFLWSAHPSPAWAASTRDSSGATLAHIAARRGGCDLLHAIASFSCFSATDHHGHTPLMSACASRGGFDAVSILAPWSDCRAVDFAGCDALMLAVESASLESSLGLLDAVQALIPRVDLFARDALGESALEKAADRGFPLVVDAIRSHLAILAERDELALAASMLSTVVEPASERLLRRARI